jgi:RimJ/RimL family protein N-acetyltransferase
MNHNLGFAAPRAEQLVLRPWRVGDAQAALRIYDHPDNPSIPRVSDLTAMRTLLERWITDDQVAPVGRWAVERRRDHRVIGGASLLPLPPGNDDLGIAWQLDSAVARLDHDDHVAEIVSTLASWAFGHHVDEVFTVAPAQETRTVAHAGRSGMHWVGETTKYFDLHLQVYRLRPADLLGAAYGQDGFVTAASPHKRAS